MNFRLNPPSILASLWLLAACGTVAPVPHDTFYRLAEVHEVTKVERSLPGVLKVDRVEADGVVAEGSMLYAPNGSEFELRQAAYDFWSEPPALMVEQRLVSYLREAGVAKQVLSHQLRGRSDYLLAVRLTKFEQALKPAGEIRLSISVSLETEPDGDLIWVDQWHFVEKTGDDTLPAAVQAFDKALEKMMQVVATKVSQSDVPKSRE